MAAPVWTSNAIGNALSSQTLLHAGTVVGFILDFTAVMQGKFQVNPTGGVTVAATNGTQVSIYRRFAGAGSPLNDAVPITQPVIPSVASTPNPASYELGTGLYLVTLKNLDTTNDITVLATSDTLSWPS